MLNKVMTTVDEDFSRLKKKEPFPPEGERASVYTFGKDEIGLLDIVLLDGLMKSEAYNR